MSICATSTPAGKRYARRVLWTMSIYVVMLVGSLLIVKHAHLHGWLLYSIALIPALPILAVMGALVRYLQEEKDEYLRLIMMRSLLIGTGVLLAVLVGNDFLRSISGVAAIPPFSSWGIFCAVFGVAQVVETRRDRVRNDD